MEGTNETVKWHIGLQNKRYPDTRSVKCNMQKIMKYISSTWCKVGQNLKHFILRNVCSRVAQVLIYFI